METDCGYPVLVFGSGDGSEGRYNLTNCCSSTELYSPESEEGDGEGGDIGGEVTNDHHLFWVFGDEFIGHDAVLCCAICCVLRLRVV